MKPQWMVERKYKNERLEIYQLVEICAENENKETRKQENQHWIHKRTLIAPYKFILPRNLAFYRFIGRLVELLH